MIGFNGGLIGAARETSGAASVPGVWTPREQLKAKRAGLWPVISDDSYFANVSLLLRGDGTNGSTTIIDGSPSPKTVTVYDNAQISTTQSKYGGSSLYFDGSGDYLTSPVNSGFEFGTGDFTVEGWFYFNSIPSMSLVTLGLGASGSGTARCGWTIRVNSSAQLLWYRYDGSVETSYSFSASLSTYSWYHIAFARSGSSLRCFVNGTQAGSTATASVSYNKINDQPLYIGRFVSGSVDAVVSYFPGYIDDLRITKGVARYTSNFTPPGAL